MQRFVITVTEDETEDVKFDLLTTAVSFEAKQLYNLTCGMLIASIANQGLDYSVTEERNYDNRDNEYTKCKIFIRDTRIDVNE